MSAVDVLSWVLDCWTSWAGRPMTVGSGQRQFHGHPRSDVGEVVPLPSIFNLVSLRQPAPTPTAYVAPQPSPVPHSQPLDFSEFRETWRACVHQIAQTLGRIQGEPESLLEQVIAESDRLAYGFGIQRQSGGTVVPLPIFLRMQAAWRLAAEEGRAQLIYGDLSGIQHYVFAAHRVGVQGLAKTLRARSARIGWIALGLPWAASVERTGTGLLTLATAGGGFSLLLPPSESFRPWAIAVNDWLKETTHARVELVVAERRVTADEFFASYTHVLESLREDIVIQKRQPWADVLRTSGAETDPWVWRNTRGLPRCIVCEENPAEESDGLCEVCALDRKIGTNVWRMHWIQLRQDSQGMIPLSGRYSLELSERRPHAGIYRAMNAPTAPSDPTATPVAWMNLSLPIALEHCPHCRSSGDLDPVRRGELYTFSCLAALDAPDATSPGQLGYLKADVDHLATVFAVGLLDGPPVGRDVYRVITLSEAVDRFFTEGLRALMEQKGQSLYAVFSGGDDVYLIGGARQIARFALTLHHAFQAYTGFHEELTLSAGVAFVPPHLSLALATQRVESALYCAKEVASEERRQQGREIGRNQVAVDETPISWSRYQALLEEAAKISTYQQQQLLGGSALHRLRQLADYVERRPAAEKKAAWFPRIAYEIRRNFMEPEQRPVRDWLMTYADPDDPSCGARIALIPLLVSLVNLGV